jgi:flagellar biosynthesis activator protein FlaF
MSYETAARTYEHRRAKGGNPRETEGRALLESARRMSEAQNHPEDKQGISTVARLNWRLWTILQAEICAPECALPPEIRTNMLNLSNFIDKRMVGILADPQPEKLDILININRQIASGLLTAVGQPDDGPADNQDGGSGPSMGGASQTV